MILGLIAQDKAIAYREATPILEGTGNILRRLLARAILVRLFPRRVSAAFVSYQLK
jgi:hypothetical protein